MVALLAAGLFLQEDVVRTHSIYRMPSSETKGKFFEPLLKESEYDTLCIEPKATPSALAMMKEKGIKSIASSAIDTKANLAWRNATIDFVKGKISPKAWLSKTKGLGETIHFLSNPKTKKLREEMGQVTAMSVCAELFMLSQPGMPCLTADDTGETRYLPGPGREESWLLAMRDYLGPMLYFRGSAKFLVTQKPKILRADDKPGLFIYQYTNGKHVVTYYVNNAEQPVELPKFNDGMMTINCGLNMDGPKPVLLRNGFMITNEGDPSN